MANRIIIGAVLLAVGIGIGATTQPTGTIQELRTRRAELEKTIAAATAELRTVNSAIAKLAKVETFPISHLEEAKDRLTATQYEAVKAAKFSGIVIAGPGNRAWHQGVYVKATGPIKVPSLTARCRFLVMDANATYQVLETDSDIKISADAPQPLAHDRVSAAWIGSLRDRPVVNAHVIVSLGGDTRV